MGVKVQYNPSTGKVSYNPATGKVQVVVDTPPLIPDSCPGDCITFNDKTVVISGVTRCCHSDGQNDAFTQEVFDAINDSFLFDAGGGPQGCGPFVSGVNLELNPNAKWELFTSEDCTGTPAVEEQVIEIQLDLTMALTIYTLEIRALVENEGLFLIQQITGSTYNDNCWNGTLSNPVNTACDGSVYGIGGSAVMTIV